MSGEVVQNELRNVSHTVSHAELIPFLQKLDENSNVIKVQYERTSGGYRVTVFYAIANLAIQLAAVATWVEDTFSEVHKAASVHS